MALPAAQLESVADVTDEVTFAPGGRIVSKGAPGQVLYMVHSGECEVDIGKDQVGRSVGR